jgi:hypothetical protein
MASALLGTLGVKLEAMTQKFVADIDKASGAVKKHEQALRTVGMVAGAAFAGMAGAIGLATKALGQQQEAELRLQAVSHLAGIDVERIKEYAAGLQQVTKFGDEATISGAAMLASFSLTEDQIITLIPRMQSLSQFLGRDLNSSAALMGKSLTASASALTDASIVLSPLQKKLWETADQMGRVALLADIIDNNVGKAAQTMSQTAVGAFTRMRNSAGDAMEEIGRAVEGPLTRAFDSLNAIIVNVTAAFASLSAEQKEMIGKVALGVTALTGLGAAFAGILLALPSIVAGIGIVGTAFAGLGLPIAVLVASIGAAILAIGLFKDTWAMQIGLVGQFFDEWAANVKRGLDGILSHLLTWAENIKRGLEGVWEVADFMTAGALGRVTGEIGGVGAGRTGAATGTEAVTGAVKELADSAKETAGTLKDIFAGTMIEIGNSIKDAFVGGITSVADLTGLMKLLNIEIDTGFMDTLQQAEKNVRGLAGSAKKTGESMEEVADLVKTGLIPNLGEMDAAMDRLKFTGAPVAGEQFADIGGEWQRLASEADASVGRAGSLYEHMAEGLSEKIGVSGDIINSALQSVGGVLARGGEQLSAAVSGFLQGFQTGGIIGAVIGAIVGLLSTLEGFQDMLEVANRGFGPVMEVLGFFVDAIGPFFDVFGQFGEAIASMTTAFSGLYPLFEILGVVLGLLADALGEMTKAIEEAVTWIQIAWEDMLYEIGQLFVGWADGVARELQAAHIARAVEDIPYWELDPKQFAIDPALAEQLRRSHEAAAASLEDAADNIDDSLGAGGNALDNDFTPAVHDAANAAREATAALTAVPQGFKVAAERFRAIETGGLQGAGFTGYDIASIQAFAQSRGITINIEHMTAADARDFLWQIEQEAAWANYVGTGSTYPPAPAPGE